MSVLGIDVSHHNDLKAVRKFIAETELGFLIAKATEGKGMKDDRFTEYMAIAKENGLIRGAYHYGHPELNEPLTEALNFLATIDEFITGGQDMLLALDWEGNALKCDAKWAVEWLNIVEEESGIKPLLYTSSSSTPKMTAVAKNNNGLWVADYTPPINTIGSWDFWAIHQYSSNNIDQNLFNGSREQLLKYAKNTRIVDATKVDCFIECDCLDRCPVWKFLNGLA